jgi:sugar lactone lactonase YvrE
LATLAAGALYLALWPVPVEPVAWHAPPNPGFTGPFARNDRLKDVELLSLGGLHGPEDLAIGPDGLLYAPAAEGVIVRARPDGSELERWARTGGRPLGLRFDRHGHLVVADAYRGLLRIAPDATVTVLADQADGVPIRYADALDVAGDGTIYFSDASTKFGAKAWGGTYAASLLDILEHGGHGRLIAYDPRTGRARAVAAGLNFANGVAVAHDQTFVLVNETGAYRVLKHWIAGPARGRTEPLVEALPGFPDNLSTGRDGRFWVALIAPRNALLDGLSATPFWRRVVQRLPAVVRPAAESYTHVIAIDATGRVVTSLQDPRGAYPLATVALETADHLYLGSLVAPAIARIPRQRLGLD